MPHRAPRSEGGFFKALLKFPADFPNAPPTMTFTTAMWHPNSAWASAGARWRGTQDACAHQRLSVLDFAARAVEPDGKVCISILHAPGVDVYNEHESADERWRPIIGIEQVLVSVMAMLGDPNINSPANVDAAVRAAHARGPRRKGGRQRAGQGFCGRRGTARGPQPPRHRCAPAPRTLSRPPLPAAVTVATLQKQLRDDPKAYRRKVRDLVARSLE